MSQLVQFHRQFQPQVGKEFNQYKLLKGDLRLINSTKSVKA